MYMVIFYIFLIPLVILFLLILFVPFHVILDLKKDEKEISSHATVKWMMLSYKPVKPRENKTKKKKKEKTKKEPSISNISDMIKTFKGIRKPVMKMITDVFHIIQIKRLYCDITYGFADPAETGIVYGFLCSAMGFMNEKCNTNCNYKCTINPIFTDNVLNYHITANIGLKLYLLMLAMIKFVANRKVLKTIWHILRERYR